MKLKVVWLQSAYVKEQLADELEKFSSWERMTTDFDQAHTYKVRVAKV